VNAKQIIEILGLEPLDQEGGFFCQVYKSKGRIPRSALPFHRSDHAYATSIYYLVTPESFSKLHRLPQDEIFHFYMGDPVEMLQLEKGKPPLHVTIGTDLAKGQRPQVVAPGNVWQGTRLLPGGKWALLGCTVSPGFEYEDFEIKTRADLRELFPEHVELVDKFT
jgi:uncharacterized protein